MDTTKSFSDFATSFPLEDVLFTGIFRQNAGRNDVRYQPRICQHDGQVNGDPLRYIFRKMISTYKVLDETRSDVSFTNEKIIEDFHNSTGILIEINDHIYVRFFVLAPI